MLSQLNVRKFLVSVALVTVLQLTHNGPVAQMGCLKTSHTSAVSALRFRKEYEGLEKKVQGRLQGDHKQEKPDGLFKRKAKSAVQSAAENTLAGLIAAALQKAGITDLEEGSLSSLDSLVKTLQRAESLQDSVFRSLSEVLYDGTTDDEKLEPTGLAEVANVDERSKLWKTHLMDGLQKKVKKAVADSQETLWHDRENEIKAFMEKQQELISKMVREQVPLAMKKLFVNTVSHCDKTIKRKMSDACKFSLPTAKPSEEDTTEAK
jgi:hypothetical protein